MNTFNDDLWSSLNVHAHSIKYEKRCEMNLVAGSPLYALVSRNFYDQGPSSLTSGE